jgi:Zn-dependent alcohol dehydrogenase
VHVPGAIMTLWKKSIKGINFGDCNPLTDIPRLLGMYQKGDLHLDELVTTTYRLDCSSDGCCCSCHSEQGSLAQNIVTRESA